MSQPMPTARSDGLIIQTMQDETLIYDVTRNEARSLNRTAGSVWKMCDGRTAVPEMTRALSREFDATLPEDVVWHALDQLDGYALLQTPLGKHSHAAPVSRRKLLKLGVAISMVPLVTSILAPTAAAAISDLGPTGTGEG